MTRWRRSASRSPISCPRSGRSSAPSALALAALAYLASYGARTPLLALRGILRVRNATNIVVPAVILGAIALLLTGRVDDRASAGAIALALVPAPLVAPEIVGRMRARADLAGALLLGTVLVSLLVTGSRGTLAAGALFTAVEAFAVAAMIANGLPMLRDAVLTPLRILGWLACAVVLVLGALFAPTIDAATIVIAAGMFVAGGASAAIVARAFDRDAIAAVGGAGLRDPALAVALAAATAGPDATGVPLVYGVFCVVLAALSLRHR